ncbi:thioredoxin domain-containing protein [Candidatus Vidania fulgoroideorum]
MSKIIYKGENSVLEFTSNWSEACILLGQEIEKVVKIYHKYVDFYKLNIDEEMEVLPKFNVRHIPTLIFFKNRKEVYRTIGFKNNRKLMFIIEKRLMFL